MSKNVIIETYFKRYASIKRAGHRAMNFTFDGKISLKADTSNANGKYVRVGDIELNYNR